MSTTTGTVKWFNDTKGFGFITPDNGGADLFAHFSEITGQGFKTLKEQQRVEFEVKQGPKVCRPAPSALSDHTRSAPHQNRSHPLRFFLRLALSTTSAD